MIGYRILSGIMILSALVGCTVMPSTNGRWIIFPENRAEEMQVGTWLSADEGGYWTPTEENILLLEQKLDSFLRQNAESFHRQPPVWEQLDNYKRQYVGLTIEGNRIIFGNFFCTDTGVDWEKNGCLCSTEETVSSNCSSTSTVERLQN